ncbi:MAG: purine-nucleoside phosphorylase [Planctomycetota bacterium]
MATESASEGDLLRGSAAFLRDQGVGVPALAVVLGSGLKRFGERLEQPIALPFSDVPHWPAPKVGGHGGTVVVGAVGGLRVACLTGRVHLYEGWSPAQAVRAVRTLRVLGVPRFLLTNAAGGIDPALQPGDLMLITDHLNMTGTSALLGPADASLGPRFPDQSVVYSPALAELLRNVDPKLAEGVYAGNLGPAYETPAEVRMLAHGGASAVGMSTVLEAQALSAMGAEVAGVSLISNLAAGIAAQPLSHDEVLAAGEQAAGRLTALVEGFCAALPRSG